MVRRCVRSVLSLTDGDSLMLEEKESFLIRHSDWVIFLLGVGCGFAAGMILLFGMAVLATSGDAPKQQESIRGQ